MNLRDSVENMRCCEKFAREDEGFAERLPWVHVLLSPWAGEGHARAIRQKTLRIRLVMVGVTFLYGVLVMVGKNLSVSKEKSSRLIAHPRGQERGIVGKKIARLVKEG